MVVKPIEEIVRFTWSQLKEWNPSYVAEDYGKHYLRLKDDTVITQKHLDTMGKYEAEWKQIAIYKASINCRIGPAKRFQLADMLTDDYYVSMAVNNTPDLTDKQKSYLAEKLTDDVLIRSVARFTPGFTDKQRRHLKRKAYKIWKENLYKGAK